MGWDKKALRVRRAAQDRAKTVASATTSVRHSVGTVYVYVDDIQCGYKRNAHTRECEQMNCLFREALFPLCNHVHKRMFSGNGVIEEEDVADGEWRL